MLIQLPAVFSVLSLRSRRGSPRVGQPAAGKLRRFGGLFALLAGGAALAVVLWL